MSNPGLQEGDPSLLTPQAILLTGEGLNNMYGERLQMLTELAGGIGLSATVVPRFETAEVHLRDLREFEMIKGEFRALCTLSDIDNKTPAPPFDPKAIPEQTRLFNSFYNRLHSTVDGDVTYSGALADHLRISDDARDLDLATLVLSIHHVDLLMQGPVADIAAEVAKWQMLYDHNNFSGYADGFHEHIGDIGKTIDELLEEGGRDDLVPFREGLSHLITFP